MTHLNTNPGKVVKSTMAFLFHKISKMYSLSFIIKTVLIILADYFCYILISTILNIRILKTLFNSSSSPPATAQIPISGSAFNFYRQP